MKTKKYFFALAMVGMFAFASCTPNSINDDENPEQIDRKVRERPSNG